jgi:hypothetical protein
MVSQKVVIPAKAGVWCICNYQVFLDTGFRQYDVCGGLSAFWDFW